jgi:hypothetical protein
MGVAAQLLVLAAGAVEARFLVSVAGVPQASLQVSERAGVYRYQALAVLEDGEARFERAWTLADGGVEGLVPEVLALLAPPARGCGPVREERSGRAETLCAGPLRGGRVEGTLDGVAFTAAYAGGQLAAVAVGPVRFERVRDAPALPEGRPGPFVEGFEVAAGPSGPRLAPPLPGAGRVRVEAAEGPGSRRRCLAVAREAVARDPSLQLVLGLVVEGGRAWPHAWVRRGGRHLDVTLGAADGPVLARRSYLELPREAAGQVYLELLDGRRRLVR